MNNLATNTTEEAPEIRAPLQDFRTLFTIFVNRTGEPAMPTSEGTLKVIPQKELVFGGARLDSWKAIAVHLGRDVRTVQRWEKREGLPVHRLFHERAGSVYAYAQEVEDWRNNRSYSRQSKPQQRTVAEREQSTIRNLLEMILAHLITQKANPP